jgi:hypothetical protein
MLPRQGKSLSVHIDSSSVGSGGLPARALWIGEITSRSRFGGARLFCDNSSLVYKPNDVAWYWKVPHDEDVTLNPLK